MNFSENRFVPKQPEELERQLVGAQETLGQETEHSLIPPSLNTGDILQMSEQELKEKFTRRYEMYRKLVQEQRARERGKTDLALYEDDIEDMQKWLKALNALDAYIQKHHDGEKTLRGKQIDVFEDLRDFLEKGGTEGTIKLPTGAGKTVLFTEFIEALDLKTLIVVPTKILVKQTGKSLQRFAKDLDVGMIYQYAKEHGHKVTITTYESFVQRVGSGHIKPGDVECLILDEAHESLSQRRSDTIAQFENAIKIGFTATPIGKLLEQEIHSLSIKEAVQEGMLCSFSAVIAKTEADLSKVKIAEGDYEEHELAHAINIASRNKAAVELYQVLYPEELAVAYCVGVEHAHVVAKEFQKAGVPAAAISGDTSPTEQENLLAQFHRGEIKVLCNADLLIEGFDEPRASVCLNLRPTRSRVVAEQRGGRVLRVDEKRKMKHASVVDFLDKNFSKEKPPVLFAVIAEGAYIASNERSSGDGGRHGGGDEGSKVPLLIDIPGLEVVLDAEEVMTITATLQREKETRKLLSLEQLKGAVQLAGVTTQPSYRKIKKTHPEWPSTPDVTYKNNGWIDWFDLFGKERGREKVEFLSFNVLKTAVQAAGIKKRREYSDATKLHTNWPALPERQYKDKGWIDWFDFLGKEKIEFLPFADLKQAVRTANIGNFDEYRVANKTHPEWPSTPDITYKDKGWIDWFDFLGKEKIEFLPFADLKKAVQAVKIQNIAEYTAATKKHQEWPACPHEMYKDKGWVNWYDFLGKKK